MVGLCWVPKFVPKFFLGFQFSLRLLSWNTTETAHGTRKSWQLNLALSRSHRAELMPTDAVAPIDSEQSEANDDRENILDFHVLHFLSFFGDPMGPLYLVYQDTPNGIFVCHKHKKRNHEQALKIWTKSQCSNVLCHQMGSQNGGIAQNWIMTKHHCVLGFQILEQLAN